MRSGERVVTLAWNGHHHLELYYGVSGSGATAGGCLASQYLAAWVIAPDSSP